MDRTLSMGNKVALAIGADVSFPVKRNRDVHADIGIFLKRKRELEEQSRQVPIEFRSEEGNVVDG